MLARIHGKAVASHQSLSKAGGRELMLQQHKNEPYLRMHKAEVSCMLFLQTNVFPLVKVLRGAVHQ